MLLLVGIVVLFRFLAGPLPAATGSPDVPLQRMGIIAALGL